MLVRFGPFTLDASRRLVSRDRSAVHLTPKAFDLLHLLVSEAPRVVTKRELHERLWPGTFVSDATLVGLVKELRKALDDHDQAAPIIRTAARVGYSFAAELQSRSPARPMGGHWLVLHGRRVPLQEGENIVGRDPAAHVWLDAAGVSRKHARIVVDGSRATVEDLGSKNGTTARNSPVTGAVDVSDGDRIAFGSIQCVYRSSSAGISTATLSRTSRPPAAGAPEA